MSDRREKSGALSPIRQRSPGYGKMFTQVWGIVMKIPILILVTASFSFAWPLCLLAQDAGPVHAPDGRAQEYISPLYFSSKPNAPFAAIAKTVWVRTLPDGSTVTSQNERRVARDPEGRVFQERVTFVPVPSDGTRKMWVHAVDYYDPVGHTWYHCDTNPKVCNLFEYRAPLTDDITPAGRQPDGTTYLTREDLGTDMFAGLEVEHSRETITLYTGSIGNTKTILRSVEYWYSPALGVNVQVKRHDPRDGDQTLWISDVSLSAPDPDTFKTPTEFQIIDHRKP
jgi:hypothetical protein